MQERTTPAVAISLAAGVFAAVQPKVNAVLGERVGSALVASLVNFGVALLCVAVALSLRPATRRRLRAIRDWPVPRWTLTAGLGGATVVVAGAVAVERIGVAVFSVAFFAGQITSGLVVDRLGLAPGGKRPITAARVQAVALAGAAIALAQTGREAGRFSAGAVALVVAAGAGVSFQSAFNARITSATRDPVAATAVNVTVGTTALVVLVGALAVAGAVEAPQWPGEPWLYTGGAMGVTVVLSLAVATAALGVLRATLATLAAQMIAAFAVDWVVQDTSPSAGVVAGGALIVLAVALVGRRPAPVAAPPVGEL